MHGGFGARLLRGVRTKDRAALEALIADDFRFTSPQSRIKDCHIEKLFAQGDEAFDLYEVETEAGAKFLNTEFFRARDGKLVEVQVYFGEVAGVTPKP